MNCSKLLENFESKNGYLPQTGIVEVLLEQIEELLKEIPDSKAKRNVLRALEPFRKAMVPSVLGLDEVTDRLERSGVTFDTFAAIDILLDAAYDLDLNYANDVIEYHVDDYVSIVT